MEKTTRPKARRLVLLYRLRMAGVLENLTLRQIGRILEVSRAVLLRDLRDLDTAEEEFRELMEVQPWEQWATSRSARGGDEEVEAIKRLTRDGMVWLRNWVAPEAGHVDE